VGTSLDSLATTINNSGLAVQATVVNVGTNTSPDYRLSVTSNNLAADTLQLNDGTNNLLSQISPGSPTNLTVNGVPTTSNSSQVTLAPGLTINILQATTGPVTIKTSQDNSSLSNSLQGFVTAYNTARDAINAQYGQNAGALSGDSIILSLSQTLDSLTQYSGGTSGLTSLANLGVTVDATGHLALDQTALSSISPANVQAFLGSATTGGFMQAATNQLTSVTDPSTGLFQASLSSVQAQIGNENSLMSQESARINQMSATLQRKLSAADATIAVLQTQSTYMSNLFASMFPNSNNSSGTSSGG
jgi:flagellar hook-associated protein 2